MRREEIKKLKPCVNNVLKKKSDK